MATLSHQTWFYRMATSADPRRLRHAVPALYPWPFRDSAFPVLLAGVVLFMILDHVPDARLSEEEENRG